MHGSAGIDIVSNNDDVFTAGPDHHAGGKAHDGAAPPSVVRRGRSVNDMEKDQQEALCLVVCPQPMQGGLPSVIQLTAVLEEGLAKKEEESNIN